MAPRSLQLRPEYRDEAKERLKKMNLTQVGLGGRAEILSPATLSNFFCCKPVDRGNFNKLCDLLSLDPPVVGEPPQTTSLSTERQQPTNSNSDICRSGEAAWYRMLLEDHSLIRIQAPVQFGKTLLMNRMLCHAEQQGHLSLYVTLNGIAAAHFGDPETFFRHFICEIKSELEDAYQDRLMPLAEYDRHVKEMTPFKAAVKYLEYFQKNIAVPFTLGINKLDRLLDDPRHAETASEFLYLLRFMNEKSKAGKAWKQFRLILAYSALRFEDVIPIADNKSPFNVGSAIDLREFNPSEVAELAAKKGLVLDESQIQLLMQLIGGIPSLVQLTLNTLRERGEELLEDATAIALIYQDFLEDLVSRDLAILMAHIATSEVEVTSLDRQERNLLYRRGLIITKDRLVIPRCELYRHFFAQQQ
jgi:AAA-like domain